MKCSRCKNTATVRLKYVGLNLCRRCFLEFFEKRVRKTVGENKYFDSAKRIAVALSGGKDSTTALYILNKILRKNKRINLIAISIDGGIKGYDDKTLANAKKICKSLGVEHHVFSFKKEFDYTLADVARTRPGLCNCGIFRRYLLNKTARQLKADKLATGHNLDDEVESILMNVIRGDVDRIARGDGIIKSEKFVPRIKPLQRCPEDEVGLYAKLMWPKINFGYQCPYRKEVLRLHIKKVLDSLEKNHPGIKFQIFEGNKRLKGALRKSSESNIEMPNTCRVCGEITSSKICQACELKEKIMKSSI